MIGVIQHRPIYTTAAITGVFRNMQICTFRVYISKSIQNFAYFFTLNISTKKIVHLQMEARRNGRPKYAPGGRCAFRATILRRKLQKYINTTIQTVNSTPGVNFQKCSNFSTFFTLKIRFFHPQRGEGRRNGRRKYAPWLC